jgi:uncharacterized protein YqeY
MVPMTDAPTPAAGLRQRLTDQLKAAMKGHDQAAVGTIRLILAKLKETDIASRDLSNPSAPQQVGDEAILAMLRGMVKSRRDSIALYRQGGREDLAAKEEAEIALIESFLPARMDEAAVAQAVDAAITETGATSVKEMGRVMAALRARHGAALDLAVAGPVVKARLGG